MYQTINRSIDPFPIIRECRLIDSSIVQYEVSPSDQAYHVAVARSGVRDCESAVS